MSDCYESMSRTTIRDRPLRQPLIRHSRHPFVNPAPHSSFRRRPESRGAGRGGCSAGACPQLRADRSFAQVAPPAGSHLTGSSSLSPWERARVRVNKSPLRIRRPNNNRRHRSGDSRIALGGGVSAAPAQARPCNPRRSVRPGRQVRPKLGTSVVAPLVGALGGDPANHHRPASRLVIPAPAGIHALTFRQRTSTAIPPPTSTRLHQNPVPQSSIRPHIRHSGEGRNPEGWGEGNVALGLVPSSGRTARSRKSHRPPAATSPVLFPLPLGEG